MCVLISPKEILYELSRRRRVGHSLGLGLLCVLLVPPSNDFRRGSAEVQVLDAPRSSGILDEVIIHQRRLREVRLRVARTWSSEFACMLFARGTRPQSSCIPQWESSQLPHSAFQLDDLQCSFGTWRNQPRRERHSQWLPCSFSGCCSSASAMRSAQRTASEHRETTPTSNKYKL